MSDSVLSAPPPILGKTEDENKEDPNAILPYTFYKTGDLVRIAFILFFLYTFTNKMLKTEPKFGLSKNQWWGAVIIVNILLFFIFKEIVSRFEKSYL